jgi:hypothetical protein
VPHDSVVVEKEQDEEDDNKSAEENKSVEEKKKPKVDIDPRKRPHTCLFALVDWVILYRW